MKTLYILPFALLALQSQAQLSGTKTVGGASPDYATLTAAMNALMSQGATGNVTFNIRPGTYTGQYSLGNIPGTPGFITIKSENNNASAVVLEYDASSSADNYIFKIDGTDGLVLDHLSFRPLDSYYGRAVNFFNGCAILQITQCFFYGSTDPDQSAGFERVIVVILLFALSVDDNHTAVTID